MAAVIERTGRRVQVGDPTTGNGGGGGNRGSDLNRYSRWGDREKGSYQALQDQTASALGSNREIVDAFKRNVGVSNIYRPGLINASIAAKAEQFANHQVPTLVKYAKTYYEGLTKSAEADLKVKGERVKAAAKDSIQLTNQQLLDFDLAQQQFANVVAVAAKDGETQEELQYARYSLEQLAKTSMAL